MRGRLTVERVADSAGRERVLQVLSETYCDEKSWIASPESQVASSDVRRNDMSWFVVSIGGRPAGTLRVLYDPPLAEYTRYGFEPLDPNLRVMDFVRANRIAEIGRFAVVARHRRNVMVAAALMRAATEDTVARGYTHYVTDVFEDDPHSPFGFHTRVMGFEAVATHDVGELQCRSRRITLVLDLRAAYKRLKGQGNWLYRYFTVGWEDALHQRLAA